MIPLPPGLEESLTYAHYRQIRCEVVGLSANLLTANQASVETDLTGLEVDSSSCTIARSTAQAAHGSACLAMTSTKNGNCVARTQWSKRTAITAGLAYTGQASFRAATTARTVRVILLWYDAAGNYVGEAGATSSAGENTGGWVDASVTAIAPASARAVGVAFQADATVTGEVHYVDRIGLLAGEWAPWGMPGQALASGSEVALVGGTLNVESGTLIRRRADLDIAVPALTTDQEARQFAEDLVAAGVWLQLTWVVTLLDGREFAVPVGLLRAESAQWVSGQGIVKVAALDLGQQVADDRFLSPRSVAGVSKVTAVGTLLAESVPGYTVAVDADVADSPLADVVWDRERDKAVGEVGLSLGAWVFWREAGGWRLQAVPDGTEAPVWTVDGDDVMVQASGSAARDSTYNAVSAQGQVEAGEGETIPVPFGVAYDNDPASPTYWHGRFGHKPRFYSSPVLATDAQCVAAATSILSTSKGLTKGLKFDAIAHPGLEPGDVVEFTQQSTGPVAPGRYLVDKITLPLGPGGMGMEARKVA